MNEHDSDFDRTARKIGVAVGMGVDSVLFPDLTKDKVPSMNPNSDFEHWAELDGLKTGMTLQQVQRARRQIENDRDRLRQDALILRNFLIVTGVALVAAVAALFVIAG